MNRKIEKITGELDFYVDRDLVCELRVSIHLKRTKSFQKHGVKASSEPSLYNIIIPLTVTEFMNSVKIGIMGDMLKKSFGQAVQDGLITEDEYFNITSNKIFRDIERNLMLIHGGNGLQKLKMENDDNTISTLFDRLSNRYCTKNH